MSGKTNKRTENKYWKYKHRNLIETQFVGGENTEQGNSPMNEIVMKLLYTSKTGVEKITKWILLLGGTLTL